MTALLHVLDARPDWSELSDDGDTVVFMGRTYRLRIEPDECGLDAWGDANGMIETYSHDYIHDTHAPRPDNFTGNAEKIQFDRGYWMWWEPPADVKRGSDQFRELRSLVRDILEFGYSSVGLEELEGTDAYNRPIVARAAWLGGIEPTSYGPFHDMLENDVLPELYAELS